MATIAETIRIELSTPTSQVVLVQRSEGTAASVLLKRIGNGIVHSRWTGTQQERKSHGRC